jgi:predicted DNA-binding ribbon-helix-helix protein
MAGQGPRAQNVKQVPGVSPLTSRTVTLDGEQVPIRLEPSYWEALEDICHREDLTVDDLCADLKARLDQQLRRPGAGSISPGVSLANAIRVFIVGYYRQAATENGHDRAGHGRGDPFVSTPFDLPSA